uniref:Uncharacterized protein LOC113795581 n=1 Tax=Dermatophagoides pteronyssinus TaxID=6956 RepID=A0A6P6YAG1_DERPT|nr:uncharacterized protein LOC113795581 [Dermatophagoides pteronyssinus]
MMEKNNMVTPKLHFISHYSEMMNFYGNLGKFATMCFERKHRLLKTLVAHSKNFINVAYSLSWLHQAKIACSDQETDETINEWPTTKNIVRYMNKKDSTYEFMKAQSAF